MYTATLVHSTDTTDSTQDTEPVQSTNNTESTVERTDNENTTDTEVIEVVDISEPVESEPSPEPEPTKDISKGAIPKKLKHKDPVKTGSDSDPERSAELKGLKEFTKKYLAENSAAASDAVEVLSDCEEAEGGMAPTIRRNSGGAYTSYVFISSEPAQARNPRNYNN